MEAPEEIAMASKDNSNINKGKRTKKRLRPQSPTPLAVISNNSIFNGNGSEFDGIPSVLNKNYTQYLSPFSSSSLEYQDSNEKEREEEDMANCLILLAQGRRSESTKQGDDRHDRFTEAASNGTGKAGRYVYECKTCNRTFPSFQALGGHRTSHTKPKAVAAAAPVAAALVDDKIRQFKALTATITTTTAAALDEEQGQQQFIKTNNVSSLSLQLIGNPNKTKVHECSICGAEFSSGQALGGHMRRHRGSIRSNMVDNIIVNPTLSLTTSMEMESQQPKKSRNASSLDFDLNFPAPEDDDHWESKFPFPSKQQQKRQQQQQKQSPLVFNAPKLVDCHY